MGGNVGMKGFSRMSLKIYWSHFSFRDPILPSRKLKVYLFKTTLSLEMITKQRVTEAFLFKNNRWTVLRKIFYLMSLAERDEKSALQWGAFGYATINFVIWVFKPLGRRRIYSVPPPALDRLTFGRVALSGGINVGPSAQAHQLTPSSRWECCSWAKAFKKKISCRVLSPLPIFNAYEKLTLINNRPWIYEKFVRFKFIKPGDFLLKMCFSLVLFHN